MYAAHVAVLVEGEAHGQGLAIVGQVFAPVGAIPDLPQGFVSAPTVLDLHDVDAVVHPDLEVGPSAPR